MKAPEPRAAAGLFATRRFERGDLIGDYTGLVKRRRSVARSATVTGARQPSSRELFRCAVIGGAECGV